MKLVDGFSFGTVVVRAAKRFGALPAMTVSIPQFWSLAQQSQLLTEEQCRTLRSDYESMRGPKRRGNSRTVASWLVGQHVVTTYQAKVLLSGRPGPFLFGAYQIDERVIGGCSTLRFRAVHRRTNHRVMLHIWSESTGTPWEQILAQLDRHLTLMHPHLDRCYEGVESLGHRLVVTEDVDGQSVETCLRRSRRFSVEEACRIGYQVVQALVHLHVGQLLHLDLRPSEIVLQPSGHVKLLRQPLVHPQPSRDFRVDDSRAAEQTADYRAPELWQSGAMPDERTDLYAFGCTMYQLLTGEVPFPGGDVQSKYQRHAGEPPPRLEHIGSIPAGLNEVLCFLVAKDPAQRYQNAAEVARRLEAFLDHSRRPTHPRTRPTESFYLAQLQDCDEHRPKHLRMPATKPAPASPPADVGHETPDLARDPAPAVSGSTVSAEPDLSSVVVPSIPNFRRRRRPMLPSVLIAVTAAVLLLAVTILIGWRTRSDARNSAVDARKQNPPISGKLESWSDPGQTTRQDEATVNTAIVKAKIIEDDGRSLWLSPTDGKPSALRYAPADARAFLRIRPRALLETAEGPRVLRSLGPEAVAAVEELQQATGLQLAELQRMTLAFSPQDTGPCRVTSILELQNPEAAHDLPLEGSEEVLGGQRLHVGSRQVFLPEADPCILVWGESEDVETVIANRGAPPLLRREMERLLRASDADRHLTFFATPNFLAADGRDLLSGPRSMLRDPILDWLSEDVQAVSLSLHVDSSFYGELRFVSTPDRVPLELAAACKERLRQVPEQVNDYLGRITIDPYWQRLAVRLPLMVNYLFQQTRIGVSQGCATVNFVLPPQAAHNLILASQLALSAHEPGLLPAVVRTEAAADDPVRVLDHRMTFEISQQSLDFTLRDLALIVNERIPEVPFEIRLEGRELQLEGITRNQQIRNLHLSDQSVGEILTAIVVRANPTTATSPADPVQKLIWVVDPTVSRPQLRILVTTRSAAARQGLTLPVAFSRTDSAARRKLGEQTLN